MNQIESKDITDKNLWHAARVVLRGKAKTLNAYINNRKEEKSKNNNLSFHLKLEREPNKPTSRKKVTMIKPRINKKATGKQEKN